MLKSENSFSNFWLHTPEERITMPVRVHRIRVSMNGSNIETIPSDTGSLVFAEACAIGADP